MSAACDTALRAARTSQADSSYGFGMSSWDAGAFTSASVAPALDSRQMSRDEASDEVLTSRPVEQPEVADDSNPAIGVGNNLKRNATLRANAPKKDAKWLRSALS